MMKVILKTTNEMPNKEAPFYTVLPIRHALILEIIILIFLKTSTYKKYPVIHIFL